MAKQSTADTLNYVRDQLNQLVQLSREAGLDTLAYLIEMAELEATTEWRARK